MPWWHLQLFSPLRVQLSSAALQTFRQWNEGEDHGPVRALLLPPLPVF